MSAGLMSAAQYLPIPKPEKLLLVALADHASDDGTGVYVTNARLQKKTSSGERAVRDTVRKLEAANLVARVGNLEGGRGLAVDYELNADFIYTVARANGWTQRRRRKPGSPPPAFDDPKPGTFQQKPGTLTHKPGGPLPPKQRTIEPVDENTLADQYPRTAGEPLPDYLKRLSELHERQRPA